MMRLVSGVLLTVVAMALGGCVNTPSKGELIKVPEAEGAPNTGWAVFSLTGSGPVHRILVPDMYFRGLDNKLSGKVPSPGGYKLRGDTPPIPIPIPSDHIMTPDDPKGAIRAIELPAGNYEFYRFYVYSNPGAGTSFTLESSPGFSSRFSVTAGKVTYIGNLNFATATDVPYKGVGTRTPVRFQVNDYRERDTKLFREQIPELKDKELAFSQAR